MIFSFKKERFIFILGIQVNSCMYEYAPKMSKPEELGDGVGSPRAGVTGNVSHYVSAGFFYKSTKCS